MKLFVIVFLCSGLTLVKGAGFQTLTKCCDIGKNFANSASKCTDFEAFAFGVEKDLINNTLCTNSFVVCCKAQLKENQCHLGLNDANNGACLGAPDSERKGCCDACSFGKMAASSGNSCANIFGLSAPYDKHFKSCCENSMTEKSTPDAKSTTPSLGQDPLPGNMCDIEDLCADICIPTGDSYRCDCHPGFQLMADNVSCKEIKPKPYNNKLRNRCDLNNPCDHKCSDTGVAIICSCREGYELGKDKRSCKDIDECATGVHECEENESCFNFEGFYQCESYDDDEEFDVAGYDKVCPPGFRFNGDKETCDDINECQIPLVCEHSQTCINTIGSFLCEGGGKDADNLICPPGFYFKDAVQECVDLDECLLGTDDCNRESEVCLNIKGSFTCKNKASKTSCPPGFKINVITENCDDIDECMESDLLCAENEECVNEPGGHTCIPKNNQFSPKPSSTTSKANPIPPISTTVLTTTTVKTTTTSTTTARPTTTSKSTTSTTSSTTTPSTTLSTTTSTFIPTSTSTQPAIRRYPSPTPTKPTCPKGFRYSAAHETCIDINECFENSHHCDIYQECINTPGTHYCLCKTGYKKDPLTGACVDINECKTGDNNCIEGERCDNTIGSFVCSRVAGCGTGFTLNYANGQCEDDDECLLNTHKCHELGSNLKCVNTFGSYRCVLTSTPKVVKQTPKPPTMIFSFPNINYTTIFSGETKQCLPGYYMDSNGNCQDINECESNPCKKNEKCINLKGRYHCVSRLECKSGYELNEAGDACIDINECARGLSACSPTAICKNYPGYHVCSCPQGHKMIQNECVDINECEFYKDRICSSTSYCMNTIGSYKCLCKDGFREFGNSCVDVDECEETRGLCDQKCVNYFGGYRCSCERGFTLNSDNKTCSDVDECEKFKDKHLCIGTCENTPGSYVCRCPLGFKLGSDGRTCQDIDECVTMHPCRNKDTICFNTRGGYECPSIICPPNYVRDSNHKSRCKKDIYKCNFGNCLNSPDQYTYHFINLVSNLPMAHGPIKFFQMKGPETSTAKFNLKVENVKCPHNKEPANGNYFRVNRETRKADISFVQAIQGPQQIELSFEMQLFSNNSYTGKVVAKIFIYVSQYNF